MGTTSLRLPSHLTRALDRLASERETSRSALIRQAVEEFLEEAARAGSGDRLELLRRLVNYPGSGRGDLARNSEAYLREVFVARRRRRSR